MSFSEVFHLLYISVAAFSSAFIALSFTNSYLWTIIAGVAFFFLLWLGVFRCCFKRKEEKVIDEIKIEFCNTIDELEAQTKRLLISRVLKSVFRAINSKLFRRHS